MSLIREQENTSNLVHESEVQRQHIRIKIPAHVHINGQKHTLCDLSFGGFKIKTSQSGAFYKAGRHKAELFFDFGSYSFSIHVSAMPKYHHAEYVAFSIEYMDGASAASLRHIIKSYISGQVFSTQDILHVVGRNDNARSRLKATDPGHIRKALLPMALIALVMLALLFVIGGNIYESVRLVRTPSAVVEGDIFTLRASSDGQFISKLTLDAKNVMTGDVIGAFIPNGQPDELIPILSPCDCAIAQHSATSGEFKLAGEALFKFLDKNSPLFVTATVKASDIARIHKNDKSFVRVASGKKRLEGRVVQITPLPSDYASVKVRLLKSLPESLYGLPAMVDIEVF